MKNNSESRGPVEEWKGYDLNQLQMRRAVNLVRIEVERQRLAEAYNGVMDSPGGRIASSIVSYLPSVFSISSIAYSAVRTLRSIFRR